ncbi:hypothetical protein KOI40_06150 [Aestuariicella sp. G3-2]|uniref:hypothetical protein n=1 Tax=Pseudomaricurvus albidus TaxID=2842452 RepID=UPI001C0B30B7|nr:hypothetical protein [Aestuariicella albida]MBU3069396.1 hypothetical protein [Aestuariicella albida]
MKVQAVDSKTGKTVEKDLPSLSASFIGAMTDLEFSDEKIKRIISLMDISADAKSVLYSVSAVTIRIGQNVVKIGRKIIDGIAMLFEEFPNAAWGVVLGAIFGALISLVPMIGVALGAIIAPISMAYGLVKGLDEDLADKKLTRKIREMSQAYAPLAS